MIAENPLITGANHEFGTLVAAQDLVGVPLLPTSMPERSCWGNYDRR
jgi:hypothetical protein